MILCPRILTNTVFPELVKAFEDIAVSKGQEMLIDNTEYDLERTMHRVTRKFASSRRHQPLALYILSTMSYR